MPLAGALAARLGCRLFIVFSTGLICLTLPLLATVSSIPQLVASLLVFGAGIGSLDVAMNIQAVIVERASGQTMMSGFHGLFSLGGIAGAAGITFLLGAGASPLIAVWCVVAGIAVHRSIGVDVGDRRGWELQLAEATGERILLGLDEELAGEDQQGVVYPRVKECRPGHVVEGPQVHAPDAVPAYTVSVTGSSAYAVS